MVNNLFDNARFNKSSNSCQSNFLKRIGFGVVITVGLILSGALSSKQDDYLKGNGEASGIIGKASLLLNQIIGLQEANAKELYNSVPWKNNILNNIVREGSLFSTVVMKVSDIIDLGNGLFAIIEGGNIRCYVLENGEMFLNIYDYRALDGMRDGTIQRIAGYKEIIVSKKDTSKIDLSPRLFGYCGNICKTPYVLCLDTSKFRFALIEIFTGREIYQDDTLGYFNAQYNIGRAYTMSQLAQKMSIQNGNKGFRINITDLISSTLHFKIMRPKHLKELSDKKRIDEVTYNRLLIKYFAKDGLFQDMLRDSYYKGISTEFGDPITLEEIDYYMELGWIDKKTGEQLKKKLK